MVGVKIVLRYAEVSKNRFPGRVFNAYMHIQDLVNNN